MLEIFRFSFFDLLYFIRLKTEERNCGIVFVGAFFFLLNGGGGGGALRWLQVIICLNNIINLVQRRIILWHISCKNRMNKKFYLTESKSYGKNIFARSTTSQRLSNEMNSKRKSSKTYLSSIDWARTN